VVLSLQPPLLVTNSSRSVRNHSATVGHAPADHTDGHDSNIKSNRGSGNSRHVSFSLDNAEKEAEEKEKREGKDEEGWDGEEENGEVGDGEVLERNGRTVVAGRSSTIAAFYVSDDDDDDDDVDGDGSSKRTNKDKDNGGYSNGACDVNARNNNGDDDDDDDRKSSKSKNKRCEGKTSKATACSGVKLPTNNVSANNNTYARSSARNSSGITTITNNITATATTTSTTASLSSSRSNHTNIATNTDQDDEDDGGGVRYVVLDLSAVLYVDLAGVDVLATVITQFSRLGVPVLLANVPSGTLGTLRRAGLVGGDSGKVGEDKVFYSVFDALREIERTRT
jgi:hypothetical protein